MEIDKIVYRSYFIFIFLFYIHSNHFNNLTVNLLLHTLIKEKVIFYVFSFGLILCNKSFCSFFLTVVQTINFQAKKKNQQKQKEAEKMERTQKKT